MFIEPTETLELNNEIRSLQFQEQREVERILRELTVAVGAQKPALLRMVEVLATVDVLQAKAKYSIEVLGVEREAWDRLSDRTNGQAHGRGDRGLGHPDA